MPDWKKICCAVDFSDESRLALDTAAELARRYGAALTLVHVYELASQASELPAAELRRAVDEARRKLEAWRREAEFLADRPVAAEFLDGRAREEIVRFATEGAFELVVVGTHGRGGLKRLVLGSVAEQVVRRAPCPVLVSRHVRVTPEAASP